MGGKGLNVLVCQNVTKMQLVTALPFEDYHKIETAWLCNFRCVVGRVYCQCDGHAFRTAVLIIVA